MKLSRSTSGIGLAVLVASIAACGGGGGGDAPTSAGTPTATNLTVSGTAATGLAIAGATVTGKCKVGTGTATTQANGTFILTVTDGQLPCVLQVTSPADGTKLHTLVFGSGETAVANITPLTEMTTARVLGSEPNVFFAAFDADAATQKITTASVASAQTAIDLVFTGTIDTTPIGDFITTPLVAATQGNPNSGDAQDKLLDALKLKLTAAQLGTVTTALASNQTTDAIKQTVVSLTTAPSVPPVAKAGAAQSVVAGSTVTLDASTSSAATGKTLTYAWTLSSKPTGSAATLAAPTTAKPTFVADVAGSYVASVIVNDGTTASSAAAVTVTASLANAAPVANAGVAQNVVAVSVVTLDGSASSDANSDPLTFAWTLTSKPAGSTAILSSTTSAKPAFTADRAGTYVASLTVNDGKVNSTAATVSVTTTSPNSIVLKRTPGSSCFFDCVDTLLTLPYSTSASTAGSSTCVGGGCPTSYTVDSFKLTASGQSYTITNLQATNTTTGSSITPFFSGLVNGQVIAAGQTVAFGLQTPFTGGSTVNLNYSFTVQETGATFNYAVQIRTN